MVTLSPRQQKIVCEVTEWYVNKARPISSLELKKRGFECSPATLRNEMHYLVQIGFLEQPHVSAGRIPDTPGYRLWIEKRKNRFSLPQRLWERVRRLKRFFHKKKPFELARDLSYLTETFVVVEEKGYIFKEGWGRIWEREDVLEEGVLEELGYWIDRAEDILRILDEEVKVWIGEELEGYRRVGTVGKVIDGGRRVLFLGPKRQHYVKEIKILEELSSR